MGLTGTEEQVKNCLYKKSHCCENYETGNKRRGSFLNPEGVEIAQFKFDFSGGHRHYKKTDCSDSDKIKNVGEKSSCNDDPVNDSLTDGQEAPGRANGFAQWLRPFSFPVGAIGPWLAFMLKHLLVSIHHDAGQLRSQHCRFPAQHFFGF